MEDAMRTQADHLANYYFILNEEAYRRLALEVKRNNDLGYTNPYHVFRGGDLSQALHDIMRDMRGESEAEEANYLNSFMSTLGEGKFARKCDVTGRGMNEGYCIMDGGMYIQSEVDMLKHLEEHTAYESLQEAFEDEYCYWTEWSDLDEDEWYLADGTLVNVEQIEAYIDHYMTADMSVIFDKINLDMPTSLDGTEYEDTMDKAREMAEELFLSNPKQMTDKFGKPFNFEATQEEEMSEADKREQREIDAFEDDRQSNWD